MLTPWPELVADALIAIKGGVEVFYPALDGFASHSLHLKVRGWKRSGLIDGAELSGFSDQPELTEVTLALLARTIGQ
jgi:hypothetical protein